MTVTRSLVLTPVSISRISRRLAVLLGVLVPVRPAEPGAIACLCG